MDLKVVQVIVSFCFILICSGLLMSQGFMYWESNFDPVALANITTQNGVSEGESQVNLFTSGDAEISADNTNAARLTGPSGDSLYTQYKLMFDGDGISKTGGSTVTYADYDSFLITPAYVTHIPDDNDVNVTLSVKASNYTGQLANAGTYTATQTLTVHWVGP